MKAALDALGRVALARCSAALRNQNGGWTARQIMASVTDWGLDPEAIPYLLPLLDAADEDVRGWAAIQLGFIGPAAGRVEERLRAVLADLEEERDLMPRGPGPGRTTRLIEGLRRALAHLEER